MALGMEVGLGPGDFLMDGDPATPRKKRTPTHPIFGPCLLWPNGWTPLGTEVDLGPGHFVLDGFPDIRERATAAPCFRPMSIVATVAHLSSC